MSASRISRRLSLGLALGSCLAALASPSFAQSLWYVNANGTSPGTGSAGDPYTSIQYAISRPGTLSGDTLHVYPGVYERIDFLGKDLVVRSDGGATLTTIDANQEGSAVTLVDVDGPNCRLQGFTLRNGTGTNSISGSVRRGGGLYAMNCVGAIVDCTIRDNKTLDAGGNVEGQGGGVCLEFGGTLSFSNCTITHNDASQGGGLYVRQAHVLWQGGTIESNRALGGAQPARGGGILGAADSVLDLDGLMLRSNLALGDAAGTEVHGGGLRLDLSAHGHLDNCEIVANDSGGWSMGYGDFTGFGGGVSSATGSFDAIVNDTLLRGNWGNSGGGGMFGNGRLTNCVIENNNGQEGGGVHAKNMVLENCVVRGNRGSVSGTYDWGGGVFVEPGGFGLMQNCEITSNFAYGQGGGGYGGTYIDCDIHHNYARAGIDASPVGGGGVADGELIDCIVHDNVTQEYDYQTGEGGGLSGGSALRCRIYANRGDVGGGTAYTVLNNCTLVANQSTSAQSGGASGGTVHNSIVRFNLPDDVDDYALVDWSNVPSGVPGTGNQSGDPLFWNAAAWDFQLRLGSPCIDAGDPSDPPDPDGSRGDMGALRFDANHCGEPIVYCTAKLNSLGCMPRIQGNGMPRSVGGGRFQVLAHDVRNTQSGLLFWGRSAAATPFQGGIQCVGVPIARTPALDSGGSPSGDDCSGSYAFTWTVAYIAQKHLQIGDTIFCQYWSRDPGAVAGSGLTNALEFTLCP